MFNYFQLCYKCHKINPNRGESYIDTPDQTKKENKIKNPINKNDNKCFQYAVTVAISYDETKKDPQRITKIKPFINKYNWERINYPSENDDWKKNQKNNVTIARNVLYAKKEKIYPAYVSKHSSNHEKKLFS